MQTKYIIGEMEPKILPSREINFTICIISGLDLPLPAAFDIRLLVLRDNTNPFASHLARMYQIQQLRYLIETIERIGGHFDLMVRHHLKHALSFASCADKGAFDSNLAEYELVERNLDLRGLTT